MEDQRVQTCDVNRTDRGFHVYSQKITHPLYRTSNQTYGSKMPSVHERQIQVKGNSRQFSEAMLQSGMYRDNGFNTSVEKSRVTVSIATQNNRVNLHRYFHHGNQSNCPDGNKK